MKIRASGFLSAQGGSSSVRNFVPSFFWITTVSLSLIHIYPTRKGIMSELLQRATGMKVIQVKDRTPVQPDCVYVIPPNKDMSILHGVLHLLKPTATRGLRLPIDFFLRSLAQDQQEHSVGVILSGMGSDGTMEMCIRDRYPSNPENVARKTRC